MGQTSLLCLKIHYSIGRRRKRLWILAPFVPKFQFISIFQQKLPNTGKHWNKLEHQHEIGQNLDTHCVKSAKSVRIPENADQKNSEYGHFTPSFSDSLSDTHMLCVLCVQTSPRGLKRNMFRFTLGYDNILKKKDYASKTHTVLFSGKRQKTQIMGNLLGKLHFTDKVINSFTHQKIRKNTVLKNYGLQKKRHAWNQSNRGAFFYHIGWQPSRKLWNITKYQKYLQKRT